MTTQTTNQRWRYRDPKGATHFGYLVSIHDFGADDVIYRFSDEATGELSLVSGSHLASAQVVS